MASFEYGPATITFGRGEEGRALLCVDGPADGQTYNYIGPSLAVASPERDPYPSYEDFANATRLPTARFSFRTAYYDAYRDDAGLEMYLYRRGSDPAWEDRNVF